MASVEVSSEVDFYFEIRLVAYRGSARIVPIPDRDALDASAAIFLALCGQFRKAVLPVFNVHL